jgi:hypothetical protein
MKNFTLALGLLFFSQLSNAAELLQAQYDNQSQVLTLDVVYMGGLKEHKFSLALDQCNLENGTKQIAARMIDTGYDDTGRQEIFETIQIPLNSMTCKPATLWIRSGRFSQKSVWID